MLTFVQDARNQLGHPTRRIAYITKKLKRGQAKVLRNYGGVRLVQLLDKVFKPEETIDAKIIYGIDPGYKHIGFCIIKHYKKNGKDTIDVLLRGVVETRIEEIKKLLDERRMYRRTRRYYRRKNAIRKMGYCKFRPARFKNRAKEMFTPSAQHLILTHVNLIAGKLRSLVRCDQINIEYFKFDSQKALNPNISGVQYQQGPVKGFDHVKAYVRHRDKYKCQICGTKNTMLHVHHIVWKSVGGSDRPDNLITLCDNCHKSIHTLGDKNNSKNTCPTPKNSNNVNMRDSSLLNSIMPYMFDKLEKACTSKGIQVRKVFGLETQAIRKSLGFPKRHDVDAYCIAIRFINDPVGAYYDEKDIIIFKQFRRHNRSWTIRYEDRKYSMIDSNGKKKIVAWNRRKRCGQSKDSLEDFRKKNPKAIVFVEKKGRRVPRKSAKEQQDRLRKDGLVFRRGNQMLVGDRVLTIDSVASTQRKIRFVDGETYTFVQLRTEKHFKHNTGLVAL